LASSNPQLLAVVPIFNEQVATAGVIREWFATLDKHVGNFVLLALDDGSTDRTLEILTTLQCDLGSRLEIVTRANRGHGQTCLEGYRTALDRSIPFILQIDSDGQSDPRHFPDFWKLRDRFDVIYGKRSRRDGMRRIMASAVLKLLLRCAAGVRCVDANVPYRLMDSRACARAIRSIPNDIFLANVALAVALKCDPAVRHGCVPIGFPPRQGGEPSVPFSKFAAKALELFRQLKRAGLVGRRSPSTSPRP
jgi:dolichol-phosphate mannosyltransferase